MTVVHGTKKFRDRVGSPAGGGEGPQVGLLGPWYATVMFWRPQVALLVSTTTLLPLFMPLAPASGFFGRFPGELRALLEAHGAPSMFIEREVASVERCELLPTRDRSVLGVMNEFVFLAEAQRGQAGDGDLVQLAVRLSRTPCSPLYGRHVSPDRELVALTGR